MLRASGRVLVALAVAAAAIAATDASARTIRLSCRDGLLGRSSGRAAMPCDVDRQCDGVCSFEIPVCGTATCETQTFAMPVRSTRRERIAVEPGAAPTRLVLRCGPTPRIVRCVTTTTTTTTISGSSTTSPAGQPGLTTTTRVILREPSSTSSSTTTSTSFTIPTTTTTITRTIPIPCVMDADCEGLATSCAVPFCEAGGICAQACVCFTADSGRTCDLDAASSCLVPDDCPLPHDATCLVCYLNLCVTAPAPACFF